MSDNCLVLNRDGDSPSHGNISLCADPSLEYSFGVGDLDLLWDMFQQQGDLKGTPQTGSHYGAIVVKGTVPPKSNWYCRRSEWFLLECDYVVSK